MHFFKGHAKKKYLVYRVWIHIGLFLDTMPHMLIVAIIDIPTPLP